MTELTDLLATLGPPGIWLAVGLLLWRYLFAEAQRLQRDGVAALRADRDEWRSRALAAERLLDAYERATRS